MNIALFASAFYPHVGGVEELVRQLAHSCQAQGHNVIVLTNRWPRSLPDYELYEGLSVYRLAFRVPEGSLKARLNYRFTHPAICRKMLAILKAHKIDLLHVQCVSSNGYYALLAKAALGIPLVVTAQGELTMDATQLYERSPFARQSLRDLLKEADSITACSAQTLAELETFFGKPFGNKATSIYNGVNLRDFDNRDAFEHPRPYILAIGRHVHQKGFDILLKAFAKVTTDTEIDLIIAGDGPERQNLECLADCLGLAARTRFVGRTNRHETVKLFRGCSFFVLPSRHEPFGIVNLEAMAVGKALIATHVGGVPEVVLEGETGLLVPCEDVDALAAQLLRMARDTSLRDRLGAAGAARARLFDWPAIAEQYLDVYRGLTVRTAA